MASQLLKTVLIYGNGMRTNGFLQYLSHTGGGFNEDGEPILGSAVWSAPVPCLIKTVTNNSKGRYEDGKFDQSSYELLIENGLVPIDIKRIRLERQGIGLGEYTVQGKPIPTTMERLKIII